MDNLARNTIVAIGELDPNFGSNIVLWGSTYDPSYFYTEGMFSALFLRIRRLMIGDNFEFDRVYQIENDEDVILFCREIGERKTIFSVVLRTKECNFNETLIEIIRTIAFRSGIYSAKKFHAEIYEAYDNHFHKKFDDNIIKVYLPMEALVFLETKNLVNQSKEFLAGLINTLTSETSINKYLYSKPVFEASLLMLSKIDNEEDCDEILDSAYILALKYKDVARFYSANKLFDRISMHAIQSERLSLQISCRIQQADIIKIQEHESDPSEIIGFLTEIDDGSLEVAQPLDRELYYCLHGYAYKQLGDHQSANDYYIMATMVAESEGGFSLYLAEAHAYLGDQAFSRYDINAAVLSYMTAASVARTNKEEEYAKIYANQAGTAEIEWSKMLASTALVGSLDGRSDSKYYAWLALKHLMKALSYMNRGTRKEIIETYYRDIVTLTQNVLEKSYDEYTIQTLTQLAENYAVIVDAMLDKDEEEALISFLKSKVEAKLPHPEPVIMLIANDGRFMFGGKIVDDGGEFTNASFTSDDDLFSGALTAIMAIFGEVISQKNTLKTIDAGTTTIMIEKSTNCIGALLVDRDITYLRKPLLDVLTSLENSYPALENWDGYSLDFSGMWNVISNLFSPVLKQVGM